MSVRLFVLADSKKNRPILDNTAYPAVLTLIILPFNMMRAKAFARSNRASNLTTE